MLPHQPAPRMPLGLRLRASPISLPPSSMLRTLDQRLVSTFLATLIAIVQWRNRAHGLLLSELGAYLLTPAPAPAGAKRVSNLLRSPRWSARLMADWLWQQADTRVQTAP